LRDVIRRPMAAALALAIALVVAGSALPAPTAGHAGIGLERFMYALGQVESGGSYTARNSSTGAYGRYQIIPSTWRAWAKEVLGSAYAPMTPANQDKVAAYKLHQAYHRIGSWPPVAYWWLTGRINTNRATWSSFARSYVDKIMRIYNGTSQVASVASVSSVSSSRTVYYQETYRYIRWSGLWATGTRPGYSGGTAKVSDQAGARMEFQFTGRAVTWYGLRAASSGVAKVYVDGVYARTIDTASTWQPSAPLFSRGWATSGTHTISIKVMGTPGRPSVVVDYFKVAK
jgi:Transglycosylase SLT domain